jgi:hypothetical protein
MAGTPLLSVITNGGNVFAAGVEVNSAGAPELGPIFQFGGAKIGFNPQDLIMMPIYDVPGGFLAVVTENGNVWRSDRK